MRLLPTPPQDIRLNGSALFYGATGLTALTDNAALTYLGTLVDGISDEQKHALVAGAVTGGGLSAISNAPNPAGVVICEAPKCSTAKASARWGFFWGRCSRRGGGVFLAAALNRRATVLMSTRNNGQPGKQIR